MGNEVVIVMVAIDRDTNNPVFLKKSFLSIASLAALRSNRCIRVSLYTNSQYELIVPLKEFVNNYNKKIEITVKCIDVDLFKNPPKYYKLRSIRECLGDALNGLYYVDVDTIFVDNPFDYLDDVVCHFHSDVACASELNSYLEGFHANINSGFIYLRNTSKAISVVEFWASDFLNRVAATAKHIDKVADQPSLRRALDEYRVSATLIPKEFNFRGHEAQFYTDWAWSRIYCIHNNLIYIDGGIGRFMALNRNMLRGVSLRDSLEDSILDFKRLGDFVNKKSDMAHRPRIVSFLFWPRFDRLISFYSKKIIVRLKKR
jgi:hypothetical protein